MGPLAGLLSAVTGGGGVTAKVAAGAATVVVAAGGVAAWQAGEQHVVRGESPGVEPGGKQLIGKPIRPGTRLPANVAIANLTVTLGDGRRHQAEVVCPPGMIAAGLAEPRRQDGRSALHDLRMYQYSERDMELLDRGSGRRAAVIRYASEPLTAPLVVSVGTMCKRR
jgi:hypothetical protein